MIKAGDRVKSFDNDIRQGPHVHGIIGTVLAINVESVPVTGPATIIDPETGAQTKTYKFDCPRYAILVEKTFDCTGEQAPVNENHIVYPPMNGTKTWMGDFCNNVEKLEG